MSRTGLACCAIFAIVLGFITLSSSSTSPASGSAASTSEITVRGDSTNGAAWDRFRWGFAGMGLAAILLVSMRQVRRLATPELFEADPLRERFDPAIRQPEGRATQPETVDIGWRPTGAGAVSGD